MKKIYISGPISKLDKTVYEKNFSDAEKFIAENMNQELTIVNPVRLTSHLSPVIHEWKQYMIPCMEELLSCNYVYMLDGWSLSRGCRVEHAIARALNLKITYQTPNEVEI